MSPQKILNLKPLKQFVLEKLPKRSILRDLILSEQNQVRSSDFFTKMDLWLKLLNLEEKK
ncbi:MAG: hypothetical protein ACTSW1_10835 [Candidatus Hodarchaeales archaeon]